MSLYSDASNKIPEEQKPQIYNRVWRSDERAKIQKAYLDESAKNREIYERIRAQADISIPDGKFILSINSTLRGIVGSPEFDFIDTDRQALLFEIETGSSQIINKGEFLDRNIAYCLGLPYGDPRIRFFHAFTDDIEAIDWARCAGVVFSGSEINVYDTAPEHKPILEKVLEVIEKSHDLPRLCICFGAQALAYSLGGKVDWVIDQNGNKQPVSGVQNITPTSGYFSAELGDTFEVAENHAQGIKPFGDANTKITTLAESELGYVEIFKYEKSLAVQFHPEVSLARIDIGKSMLGEKNSPDDLFKHDLSPVRHAIFSDFLSKLDK